MELRPYQLELIDAVWEELFKEQEALAQLPTGGGKTLCFSHLLKRAMEAKPDIRCGVIMGRVDLVSQTEAAIARVVPRRHIGVYCGSLGRKEIGRSVTVASIQSIEQIAIPRMNLLIVDEVHNFDQKSGAYLRFIEKARLENPRLKVVGFSATPFRTKGYIFGEGMFFKRLCFQKTIHDMIALGFLCEPKLKLGSEAFDTSQLRTRAGEYVQEDVDKLVSNDDTVAHQIDDALAKSADRTSIAWATANIDHCNRVLDHLIKRGQYATSVHSKQDRTTRNSNLAAFMGGACRHMVFVSVLSEGFDHPPIDCVVLMRPTRSPVLYVQTCGRGLRISPETGKKDCLVLDYGQVVRELGPLDSPKVKGAKGEGEAVLKCCPICASYVPGGCRECPECAHQFPPPEKPEEKLTKRADHTAQILSNENRPEMQMLGPAVIAMHQSKSGNVCVRITYEDRNLMNKWGGFGGISEFFVVSSPWAMERLERRLDAISGSVPSIPFEEPVIVNGSFEVVKTKDGRFDRILSVKRTSELNPYGSQEEPTFNFGANVVEDAKPNSREDIGF